MQLRRLVIAIALALAPPAAADHQPWNFFAGPLVGYRLGHGPGDRLVLGAEGGVGYSLLRANVGFEHRLGGTDGYLELDPWLFVGASLGIAVDDEAVHPIVGVWEGLPVLGGRVPDSDPPNEDCVIHPNLHFYPGATFAIGYRYSGIHELYATVKVGYAQPFCLP